MTANKYYVPAFIGGKIKAVEINIQNTTGSSITLAYRNGVYYSFQGNDYQLLSCGGSSVAAGETIQLSQQLYDAPVPTGDIMLMVDTAGLAGCVIEVLVLWEVGE